MDLLTHKGPITCICAPALNQFDFLTHAFCTRLGGVSTGAFSGLNMSASTGDDKKNISKNWQILSEAFAIAADRFFLLRQVHSDQILILNQSSRKEAFFSPPACDAVITDQPNIALCIKTADCVPIVLVDPQRGIIANIHAGWKGTALNIASKVVRSMAEHFGSRAEEMVAAIGPAIGPCCYEVDEPVVRAMGSWGEDRETCRPAADENHWMLDLPRINRQQMIHAGIPGKSITTVEFCTSCRNDLFYSHRRDRGKTGRQVHFIMMRGMNGPGIKKA